MNETEQEGNHRAKRKKPRGRERFMSK